MCPLHLNYTTTLPCKTITMNITIFHRGFFGNTRILITNGQRTHGTLIILITMSRELCFNATRHFNPSQMPSTSWRMSCKQYVMICHRTPSTRPSVDTLYSVRFTEVSGLSSFKNFYNQTTGCGDIGYCLVGYFILSHPVEPINVVHGCIMLLPASQWLVTM